MKNHSKSFSWLMPIVALTFLLGSCNTESQTTPVTGGGEANPELKTNAEALKNWQDMRFGMFVHWGPVALKGTEIGWSRGREIPFDTYDSLYHEFNPVNFNAEEWISVAKEAGMKYFVITSKHHDGFSLYDTEYSDYNIMNTPIKRDLMKEMQVACENQGLMFGTYYSVLDWYHPDYPIHNYQKQVEKETHNMEAYKKFMYNQVEELVNKYNTNLLWFDGEWEEPWTHEYGMDFYKYCRSLKDDLLINNRVDKGRAGMQGMTKGDEFAGDFGTPEQEIGEFHTLPWESCITICNQWAWKPDDVMKSTKECIHTLIKTIGGDGNLLLNVGPMPDGRIEPRQVEVLKEIGAWVGANEQAIYATRGGPYMPTENLAATRKGKDFYLFVMDGSKEIVVPGLPGVKVKKVEVLSREDCTVKFVQKLNVWTFEVSGDLPSDLGYVIRVRTNIDLSDVEPVSI